MRVAVALCALLLTASLTFAQKNGATLQASKTVDICSLTDGSGLWRYSGEVSVWNEGAAPTAGLKITDCIENKLSGPKFTSRYCSVLTDLGLVTVPGFTPEERALTFPYTFDAPPLTGTIRNNAVVTITNHSGHLGVPFGPNPKATYPGVLPPPACATCGCTYTQGYWGNKPGVEWPAGYDRADLFFNSGMTWQQILDASAGGSGYIILAKQYIAAVLNQANNACVPQGVQETLTQATGFFSGVSTPVLACPSPSSCGYQKTLAGILDDYNNGRYPGSPGHCGDEE